MGAKKKKGGKKAAEPKAQVSSSEQMAYKIQSLEGRHSWRALVNA